MGSLGGIGVLGGIACSGGGEPGTPIGATLDDGQLLIGSIHTPSLQLQGAFGPVAVPLPDVGMLLPVEGHTLEASGSNVTVWLRNGSELRGKWAAPELSMGLSVGGRDVEVQVPTGRMQALQLQGSESWPEDGLYRVRTSWGDDFLVDPAATRIELENELGSFDPFLTECRSVGPIGDPSGEWRIELVSGTVLIGPLRTDEIAFALPMGPEQIVVPLASLVALERGAWPEVDVDPYDLPEAAQPIAQAPSRPRPRRRTADGTELDQALRDGEIAGDLLLPEEAAPAQAPKKAVPGLSREAGWFDNRRLESAKR